MFSFWYILTNNFFEDHSLAEIMAKPKQKHELNDISDQLEQMTKQQLLRLFFTIIKIIPISFALLSEYQIDFINLVQALGKALAESLIHKKVDNPNIDDLAEASINLKIKEENVFLFALFSRLSGGIFDKEVAANTLDAIRKIADPELST